MTAIVVNTVNGAVTEYDWTFQSITPTHAGDVTGLFELTGDTDNGAAINAHILSGHTVWSTLAIKYLDSVYFAIRNALAGALLLAADNSPTLYSLPCEVRPGRVVRAKAPRGLRANWLAFGYANTGGDDFVLDRIEVPNAQSDTRRI